MYQTHWGLSEPPFRTSLDPNHYYKSATHDEALARLQYLVDNHRRLGLLSGPHGSGKSFLQKVFARELATQGHAVVSLSLLGISVAEFEWTIASQLGTKLRQDAPTFQIWRAIVDRLIENRYQQISTVFLLDDVDQGSADIITHIIRLVQVDPSLDSRVTVIVTSTGHRGEKLDHRLLDLAELRVELGCWQESETSDYLSHCLSEAGRTEPVFDDGATNRLHELCEGIPRQINQLAHLVLLAGAGQESTSVNEAIVESVYQELLVTINRELQSR